MKLKRKAAKSNDRITKPTVGIAGIKEGARGKSKGYKPFVSPASILPTYREYNNAAAAIINEL